jgi:hypothetical protein
MNEGAFRGVILVGVAVLIGAILLSSGLDDSSPVTIGDDSGSAGATTTTAGDSNTTVVPNDSDKSVIPVVVANGSGVEGAAGNVAALLTELGYPPADGVDTSPEAGPIDLDTVFYVTSGSTSFQTQAELVAADLGLGVEAVREMPDPPPANYGLAGVLVVLGSSGTLASSTPAPG